MYRKALRLQDENIVPAGMPIGINICKHSSILYLHLVLYIIVFSQASLLPRHALFSLSFLDPRRWQHINIYQNYNCDKLFNRAIMTTAALCPNLTSNYRTPKIFWYQTDNAVFIRIILTDVEKYSIKVDCDTFKFRYGYKYIFNSLWISSVRNN